MSTEAKRKWDRAFKSTVSGKAKTLWDGLSRRANNRIGTRPTYTDVDVRLTRQEFMSWAIPELEKWIITHSLHSATVDRKDTRGHYELSNIQILSKSDNSRKLERNKNVVAPDGYAWCGGCKSYLTINNFYHNSNNTHTGTSFHCKQHSKEYMKRYRKTTST